MRTFTATELKQNSGKVLDTALQIPVSILKHGRAVAVLSSEVEYQEFLKYRQVKQEVEAGFAQIGGGESSCRSMDELFKEAQKQVAAQKKNSSAQNCSLESCTIFEGTSGSPNFHAVLEMSLKCAVAPDAIERPPGGPLRLFPQDFVTHRTRMFIHVRFPPRPEKKCSRRENPSYRRCP